MRTCLFVNLLSFVILAGIPILITRQVEAAGSANPNGTNEILQFTSGGHGLGLDAKGMYVSSDTQRAASLSHVTYPNLWDGVTLTYDAPRGAALRSSYRIDPYASPEKTRLRYDAPVSFESDDSLHIFFQTGEMNESVPQACQERDGKRAPTEIAFPQYGKDEIGFVVGEYDQSKPLFIDPTLTWNTFLGGSGTDVASGVALDGTGNVYVAGHSNASWGSPVHPYSSGYDVFVAKLNSSGNLIWNTFLGGSGGDYDSAVAVDGNGNVYVTGQSNASWGSPVRAYTGGYDAFAAKLDSSGNLIWNTFLGSSGNDVGNAVAVDRSGNVYVAGQTEASWGSPVRAYNARLDAFAAKLDSSGNLIWNTFLGSSTDDYALGVVVDGSGNVYMTGESLASWGSPLRAFSGFDAFVAKLDSSGNLIWNTFLGSSADDGGRAVTVDGSGNVYVVGQSFASWGLPLRLHSSEYDAFAAKLDSSGNLIWNTFLGGSGNDVGYAMAVDGSGNVYVAGASDASWGSPVRPYSSGYDGFGNIANDAFAARLDSSGNLIWNTFLGSSAQDIGLAVAVDGSGNLYVAGYSFASWGSPVHSFSGGSDDAFVAKVPNLVVAPTVLNVPGDGAGSFSTLGSSANTKAGYAQVQSGTSKTGAYDASLTQVYGTAVFSYTQGGNVVTEVGVPASVPTTQGRIFIDYRTGVAAKSNPLDTGTINIDTGMALVNRGTATANITFTLHDRTGDAPIT
ncbi:MAG: SBBP repeat-containing protein, partial [Acidobacteriia bacterium]|nr:SBBP repeat-containing protein [Terriglobia bacterium]